MAEKTWRNISLVLMLLFVAALAGLIYVILAKPMCEACPACNDDVVDPLDPDDL